MSDNTTDTNDGSYIFVVFIGILFVFWLLLAAWLVISPLAAQFTDSYKAGYSDGFDGNSSTYDLVKAEFNGDLILTKIDCYCTGYEDAIEDKEDALREATKNNIHNTANDAINNRLG